MAGILSYSFARAGTKSLDEWTSELAAIRALAQTQGADAVMLHDTFAALPLLEKEEDWNELLLSDQYCRGLREMAGVSPHASVKEILKNLSDRPLTGDQKKIFKGHERRLADAKKAAAQRYKEVKEALDGLNVYLVPGPSDTFQAEKAFGNRVLHARKAEIKNGQGRFPIAGEGSLESQLAELSVTQPTDDDQKVFLEDCHDVVLMYAATDLDTWASNGWSEAYASDHKKRVLVSTETGEDEEAFTPVVRKLRIGQNGNGTRAYMVRIGEHGVEDTASYVVLPGTVQESAQPGGSVDSEAIKNLVQQLVDIRDQNAKLLQQLDKSKDKTKLTEKIVKLKRKCTDLRKELREEQNKVPPQFAELVEMYENVISEMNDEFFKVNAEKRAAVVEFEEDNHELSEALIRADEQNNDLTQRVGELAHKHSFSGTVRDMYSWCKAHNPLAGHRAKRAKQSIAIGDYQAAQTYAALLSDKHECAADLNLISLAGMRKFDDAQEYTGKKAFALMDQAREEFKQKEYGRAAALAELALHLMGQPDQGIPTNAQKASCYLIQAKSYIHLGKYDRAEHAARQSRALRETAPAIRYTAIARARQGDLAGALAIIEPIVDEEQRLVSAWQVLLNKSNAPAPAPAV